MGVSSTINSTSSNNNNSRVGLRAVLKPKRVTTWSLKYAIMVVFMMATALICTAEGSTTAETLDGVSQVR